MDSFKRVFAYILPQWPRVIIVVVAALVVAMLLSVSFLSAIPLMRVMIGSEGLHGWVDRKTCEYRYGLEFDVPDRSELIEGGAATALRVRGKPHKGSLAAKAGIRRGDMIVGVAQEGKDANEPLNYIKVMAILAQSEAKEIKLEIMRLKTGGTVEGPLHITLATAPELGEGAAGLEKGLKASLIGKARSVVSRLDRGRMEAHRTKAIIVIMAVLLIVTAIRCLAKYYQSYLAEKIVQVGMNRLREDAFVHMMNMPVGYFAGDRGSDIVSRLVRDTGIMGKGIKVLLGKALREPLNATFLMGTALVLNWQLSLIFCGGAPAVLWVVTRLGKSMKKATRKSLEAWSQMLGKLQETVSGLKIVKVYNRQDYDGKTFKAINDRLLKQLLKISRVEAATSPSLEVLGMLAGAAAITFGAHWVSIGNIDGETFLVILALLGAAAEAIRKTSDIWNNVQEANAAAERVFRIMDEPLEPERKGVVSMPRLRSRIEMRDVTFTYPDSDRPALNGVNLTIQAGDNVAIVGANGSGKTTLVNLLPRFYDPQGGAILIDGHDIRDFTLKSLREQMAMVTQNVVTFNDTVAANIGYARPGAAREEIVEAAKRAFAHEFIEPLPDGYDTMIGEQGTGLSGGQLQRIVIARAILRDPAILIFDEATSQVDADSEAKIHKAIEEVMADRTSLIIAHRFSTVISADIIVVMDKGRIMDQGRHKELIERCALYRSLYETQLVTA